MLPQSNATLYSITSGESGSAEDWDQPSVSGTDSKWAGSEDAYVIEKIRTSYPAGEGGLTKTKDIQLIVSSNIIGSDGSPLNIETGDTVTYEFMSVVHTRRVMDYAAPYLPGLGIQEYINIHLNPEPVETALEQQ